MKSLIKWAASMRALKAITIATAVCLTTHHGKAAVLTNIYSFTLGSTDGYNPSAGLLQGADGSLYGTVYLGGSGQKGTVFKITSSGIILTLHAFTGTFGGGDGSNPSASLMRANDGNIYGTTIGGGTFGNGTVFRLSPSGTYSNIFSFPSGASQPYGRLIQGADGNLYGTTYNGAGTVFRINLSGSGFTNLHTFSGMDGLQPLCGLTLGPDGSFYGTTKRGGSLGWDGGTVFKITPSGTITSLHSFTTPDGYDPEAPLTVGPDGNLYGTTRTGGSNNLANVGTVFRISTNGEFSSIHGFKPSVDGGSPVSGLTLGSDGLFYGMTRGGGVSNVGTVFSITTNGVTTMLHSFTGKPDGSSPEGELIQTIDGSFYGTTLTGGTNDNGTVFRLTIPFDPPVNKILSIQKSGSDAVIKVQTMTGATYQLQQSATSSASWSNVAGAVGLGTGGPLTVTNIGGFSATQRFYRFNVTP